MAPKAQETRIKKISLLNFIKSKKSILFGKFSSELDKREKSAAWDDVVNKAKSLGLATAERDKAFVRDRMWGVWKTRALEKRDNKNKTGTGGGIDNVLTEVDKLIIDIIGSETAVVEGLAIGETGNAVPSTASTNEDLVEGDNGRHLLRLEKRRNSRVEKSDEKEEQLAKKRTLQCELLHLSVYKTRLEALKLERELSLPVSTFTEALFN